MSVDGVVRRTGVRLCVASGGAPPVGSCCRHTAWESKKALDAQHLNKEGGPGGASGVPGRVRMCTGMHKCGGRLAGATGAAWCVGPEGRSRSPRLWLFAESCRAHADAEVHQWRRGSYCTEGPRGTGVTSKFAYIV